MHQTIRLLPQASAAEKRVTDINRQMTNILRYVPERAGGSHMMVKAFIAIAKGRKGANSKKR